MSELQNRLDRLALRLDRMGMRVEQALGDALSAVENRDAAAGKAVHKADSVIDREEVEIEQECVRLLALYQPAAVDLRRICTVIKVNSDLERIADLAAGIGKRVKHVVSHELEFREDSGFGHLAQLTRDILGRTVRMVSANNAEAARGVIDADGEVDRAYKHLVRVAIECEAHREGGAELAMTLFSLAKSMERVGDLCTNIAEDIIFMQTGDIVRHAGAFDGNDSETSVSE